MGEMEKKQSQIKFCSFSPRHFEDKITKTVVI